MHKLLQKYNTIILTGHMCILNKNMSIEELPQEVYGDLEITGMVLLKNKPDVIVQNLMKRDKKEYNVKLIDDFKEKKKSCLLKQQKL